MIFQFSTVNQLKPAIMIKKRWQIINAISTMIIICCNGCKSDNTKIFYFDPRQVNEKSVLLSEMADDISYVCLDDSIPLGNIISMKILKNSIYLNSQNIGILKYDRNGILLNRIGNIGKGPGEYLNYLDFCIDEKSGSVYLRDIGNIIKVYSGTGKFVRSFPIDKVNGIVENINFFSSKLFLQYSIQYDNCEYEWIFYDTLGQELKKQKRHLQKFTTNYSGRLPSYTLDNKLNYFNHFTDTTFSISPNLEEYANLVIKPGDHRLPKKNLPPGQFTSGKYMLLNSIIETYNFFFINYFYFEPLLVIINKSKNDSQIIKVKTKLADNVSGITNDLDGGIPFIPRYYFVENSKEFLAALINPIQIIELTKSVEFNMYPELTSEKKSKLKILSERLKDTDNPVIVMVKLRN